MFGDPAGKDLWGWRFEGHHISLNFTSEAGILVSSTPTFYGSNPGKVSTGNQRGKEVLKLEGSLGFELLGSFSQEQLQRVRFSEEAPRDIISANKSEAIVLSPKGISYEEMSEKQQQVFLKLIDLYIVNYEFGFAGRLRNKIDNAGIENFYFAWAGSLVPGQGHYYRIQGPDILIEYDNVQDNANHVHSVVRELSNDFAGDILKRHYEQEHK
ncbi:MAG: DUF3500 domain-containing protein [Cyclobacteriaceae bacterium]|nr:DUF3500 domain-containing protein [Cyclobacteriaceae bacterium]